MKLFILTLFFLLWISACWSSSLEKFPLDGKVLELNETNIKEAISSFDYICVAFYAPWCQHCKSLTPQFAKAAAVLAKLKKPIALARLNAAKYKNLATKYEIDGYPTLLVFIHGVPAEYFGSRKADLLVHGLKKFVSPDVSSLTSDSDITDFIDNAGTDHPIFIGFGLNEAVISNLAVQHKEKAWFAVAKDFSEDTMMLYDFDKVPALVALHLKYDEKSISYGPFEDNFLENFVKENLLPLVVPMTPETAILLKDDARNIVLTIMRDEGYVTSKDLVKLLKDAATANRDLVFAFVGFNQWEGFASSFEVKKQTKLPKMVVWDGNEGYLSVIGSDSIEEGGQGSQITRFLEGYREGNVIQKQLKGPSFVDFIQFLLDIRTIYVFIFLIILLMLLRSFGYTEEPLEVKIKKHEKISDFQGDSKEADHQSRKKED